MPPRRKNKRTSGPENQGDRRRSRRIANNGSNVTVATTQPAKKRRVQDPLTRNDIPTIVQAVLEALPGPPSGPSDTTDPSPNCNPSTARSDPPSQVPGSFPANQPTTETRDPGTVQPLHSATEQGQSGRGGSIRFDPSECYLYYK